MARRVINIGDKFSMLTVVSRARSKSGKSTYNCVCDCGNISRVMSTNLTAGKTRSCGCSVGRNRIDIGQRFGRLVVEEKLPVSKGKTIYLCLCDCGNRAAIKGSSLNRGTTQSCGCYRRERVSESKTIHGNSGAHRSRTYRTWESMMRRCNNLSHKRYHDWGGRGITVCEEWRTFANFLADMGNRPLDKTLDRIDNDGNYCRANCRWATAAEQAANRRNS